VSRPSNKERGQKQDRWQKKTTKNKKKTLLGSWKEAREKSVTNSMQSPVEANHSGSQRESPPGSFTHKIIYISVFARYRQSNFFNLLSFYILLTVHLVMILGKWQTWRTILFYVFISILYMFRATSCSSSGESVVSIQQLVYVTRCRWPFRVQVGKKLPDLHTKRSPTESDIYQMYWCKWFSWWWARGCSKHVENLNKHKEKKCA
jgi:hypothetical protein